jgi:hypothetical protein
MGVFFSFFSSVRFTSAQLASSPPFLLWSTSPRRSVVSHFLPIEPRRAHYLRFIFWQRFISSPPLLSWNWSIKSTPLLTVTLHCYKKIISILVTLTITQPRLYFSSSLPRAPRHQSSTRYRRSLSSSSFHTYRPSTQQHSRWWTSRPLSLLE